jgi:hypothetical protein
LYNLVLFGQPLNGFCQSVVAVAQLVESRIVIPVVVGSSPISHPKEFAVKTKGYTLRLVILFVFWKMNSNFWKIVEVQMERVTSEALLCTNPGVNHAVV